jgi:hypothetical protein
MSMMQPTNRGGYRKPENPAPVSGPGALSARTDGGPTQAPMYYPDTTYGQGGYMNQQGGAPMVAGTEMPQAPTVVGINEPTQFPDEPISYGSSWGPGPGLSAVVPQGPNLLTTLEKALQYDDTGIAEFLYNRLNK